uniref:Uncharacterized protein n=1 Tax=uncultured marine virus TaxID=186617 RepID=A0A0F7L803_9VIRU|nr:hypothetical protein [uncultured marine virus]
MMPSWAPACWRLVFCTHKPSTSNKRGCLPKSSPSTGRRHAKKSSSFTRWNYPLSLPGRERESNIKLSVTCQARSSGALILPYKRIATISCSMVTRCLRCVVEMLSQPH